MKSIRRLIGGVALSVIPALAHAATTIVDIYGQLNISVEESSFNQEFVWDAEALAPQIAELNRLGWHQLPLGTASLDMFSPTAVEIDYQGVLSLNINTGELIFTVTDNGPLQGQSMTMAFISPDTTTLLNSFIAKASSLTTTGASTFTMSRALTSLAMGGAHHRPLMTTKFPKGNHCMWVTGDAHKNNDADFSQQLAEIGICKDFFDGKARAGAGIGANHAQQDLAWGGNLKFNGNHFMAEIDYQTSSSLLLSAIGIYGWGDSDIRRGYPSLITPPSEISSGSTSTATLGGRIRADLVNIARFGQFTITPYLAYTYLRTEQDAYTEAGGSAPAQFDKVRLTSKEGTVGMTAKTALSPRADIGLNIEAVHRFDADNTPTVSGQMMGLAFDLATPAQDANYWRASIDLDYQVSDQSLIALSVLASDSEPGPAYTGSISWRTSF